MNNRDYKKFAAGEHYHVYNRGNAKMDIFRDANDYELLLSRLHEALFPNASDVNGHHSHSKRNQRKKLPRDAFTLVAYVLMPNHFHLLVRQNTDLPISTLMLNVFGGYSKCFNKKYERVGSLFQDQFKAVHVDSNEYLLWLSVYIHLNPKTASMVRAVEEYPYSSYHEYVGAAPTPLCDPHMVLDQFAHREDYIVFMRDAHEIIHDKQLADTLLIDSDV
jgi:REP element-mobilizing transposase RayT